MIKKNKILLLILVIVLIFIAWQTKFFGLFTLQPITIDPSTCQNPTLIHETHLFSDTLSQPGYPYAWESPTIIVAYNGETGSYINTISGDSIVWGSPEKVSTLVRVYKCSSAKIVGSSPKAKVLTDNIIPNPLGQSSAFSSICVVGQCFNGWECKTNSLGGTYYKYTSCGNASKNPPRFCGNGILENGETQENCCKDAGCPQGYECKYNECVKKENYKEPETCGNGKCDNSETQSNCCLDCGCPASQQCINNECIQISYACGNNICDQGETPQNCPIDCGARECIEGQIEYIECDEGFRENFWAYRQCLNGRWVEVSQGTPCYCVGNNYCKPGYKCSKTVCVPDLPEFCSTSSDCKISGYYCNKETHKCEKCIIGIPECELTGFKCNSANDCFGVSNNFCANWICSNGQCVQSGLRFEGCCNDNSQCSENKTCTNHICVEKQKSKPSIINIIITILIISGIGVGIYLVYTKTKLFK